MKWTIEGFSQQGLLDLGLDTTDATILRWIVDFKDTGRMKKAIIKNEEYVWIHYQTLMNELPIIGITNTKSMGRRLKKMCDCKLLELQEQKTSSGTFTFYRINGKVYCKLVSSYFTKSRLSNDTPGDSTVPSHETQESSDSGKPTAPKSHPKDSSINDPSTNIYIYKRNEFFNDISMPEKLENAKQRNLDWLFKTWQRLRHVKGLTTQLQPSQADIKEFRELNKISDGDKIRIMRVMVSYLEEATDYYSGLRFPLFGLVKDYLKYDFDDKQMNAWFSKNKKKMDEAVAKFPFNEQPR